MRIHEGAELTVEDHVTIENHQGGPYVALSGERLNLQGGTLSRVPVTDAEETSTALYLDGGSTVNLLDGEIVLSSLRVLPCTYTKMLPLA